MADFTLPNTPFPEGTSVSAYSAAGYSTFPAGGPPGSPVATASVTKGSLTFGGLSNHMSYFAAAQVSGQWQSKRFMVGENGPPPSLDEIDFADVGAGRTLAVDADESGYEFVDLDFSIGMSKARPMPTEDADKDTERLQEAFGNESPNEVLLGAGNYRTNDILAAQGAKSIAGAGQGVTVLTLEDGADCDLLQTADYGSETVPDLEISKLTLDGNRDNNAAGSGIVTDAERLLLRRLVIAHFADDGVNHKMSHEGDIEDGGLDSSMEYVMAADVGRYGIYCAAHDSTLKNCQGIQCEDTGIYCAANGYMELCHTWGWDSSLPTSMKTGMRLAVDVHCRGCIAEGAVERQVLIAENSIQWFGGELFNSVDAPNAHLFEINGGTSPVIVYPNCHDFGTGGAVHFATNGQGAVILLHAFDNEDEAITGAPHDEVFYDVFLGGSTKIGKGAHFKRKQVTFQSSPAGTTIPNKTLVVQEENGNLQFKDGNGTLRNFQMNAKETVVAAAEVAFSTRASLMELTGAGEVKKIAATYAGHRITVWMPGGAKLLDEAEGGNLKLAGNIEGGGVKMVDLVCDGVNWRQTGPAVTL